MGKKVEPEKNKDKYSKLNKETTKVANKMKFMVDPFFWCSICFPDGSRFQIVFEDRPQREHFLKELKIFSFTQAYSNIYIDASKFAKAINFKKPIPKTQIFTFKKEPDPLKKISYSGDPESDSIKEMSTIKKQFPKPIPFKSSEAERFIDSAKINHLFEHDAVFGATLCDFLNISLPPSKYFYRAEPTNDKKLNALV